MLLFVTCGLLIEPDRLLQENYVHEKTIVKIVNKRLCGIGLQFSFSKNAVLHESDIETVFEHKRKLKKRTNYKHFDLNLVIFVYLESQKGNHVWKKCIKRQQQT